MFFLSHLGTVVIGIWCSVGAKEVSADMGPAGMYLGLDSPVPIASLFREKKNGTCCSLLSKQDLLACKVTICFSCRL